LLLLNPNQKSGLWALANSGGVCRRVAATNEKQDKLHGRKKSSIAATRLHCVRGYGWDYGAETISLGA